MPTHNQLSAAEQALQERLQQHSAKQPSPLTWTQLQTRRSKSAKPFYPWALAATVAMLVWFSFSTSPVTAPSTTATPMLLAEHYQLDALDQRIQQAYLRGANAIEIDTLWAQRERLTQAIQSPRSSL